MKFRPYVDGKHRASLRVTFQVDTETVAYAVIGAVIGDDAEDEIAELSKERVAEIVRIQLHATGVSDPAGWEEDPLYPEVRDSVSQRLQQLYPGVGF